MIVAVACTGGGGGDTVVTIPFDDSATTLAPASDSTTTESPEATSPATRQFTVADPTAEPRLLGDIPVSPQETPQETVAALTPLEIVDAYDQVIADVYEKALLSTVEVIIGSDFALRNPAPIPRPPAGTGFIWDRQGRIVTNHHVVVDATSIRIRFANGVEVDATVLGTDPDSDLAVLQVDLPEDALVPIELGDSDVLRPGVTVLALGNPFTQSFTLTKGIVSAKDRTIESPRQGYSIPNAIQTDAAINPGNSGGPLMDSRGRVIGINSQIDTRTGSFSGIGLAIPINQAKRVVPALIEDGVYHYSYLGITGGTFGAAGAEQQDLSADTRGAYIERVLDGGPSDDGGLKPDDVIVGINGRPVTEFGDLIGYLHANTSPGDIIVLDILRRGVSIVLEIEMGTRPVSP